MMRANRPIEILMIEDSESDVVLTREILRQSKLLNRLHIAPDGEAGLDFLLRRGDYRQAPAPDLVLLDLNLPKLSGHEVLARIKQEPALKRIPVVILTTSTVEQDIVRSYDLQANCYISKPVDLIQFRTVVAAIDSFWFQIVKLPSRSRK